MRRIIKIAKAELFTLFYSPIAWFVLVVFAVQTGLTFVELLQEMVQRQAMGYGNSFVTANIFIGQRGLFTVVQNYLYLYIPLLTMGLMSREYSSGSIKLLYSSPLKAKHIILGKFGAMMSYGLVLTGILFIYVLFAACTVQHFDFPSALSGLLGLYLLICTYAAIGLFMSSLTSYQVVAAIGTLVLLAVLNYIGRIGQDIEFVRDITWWLAISGRCNEMVAGLICSEDVLYFVIVSAMFLMLSVLKVQSTRLKESFAATWGKYLAVVVCAMLLGYVTSRPKLMFYCDTTDTKRLTLTEGSQEIMKKLDGPLTITTYTNLLDREYYHAMPAQVSGDLERFKQYRRFKPEIKFRYVYYYDEPSNNPWLDTRFPDMTLEEKAKEMAEIRDLKLKLFKSPEEIRKIIDLTGEGNTFVRLVERYDGQKAFLRIYNDMMKHPSEAEITAVFKRMVMKLPKVGFLTGHGERSMTGDRARDYKTFSSLKTFRYALTNQGCDVVELDLSGGNAVPEDMDIVIIADMQAPLTAAEQAGLDAYIARGGNLIIAAEARSDAMDGLLSQFGVGRYPGMLVQPREDISPDYVLMRGTGEAVAQSYLYEYAFNVRRFRVGMTRATALTFDPAQSGFKMEPILRTDSTGVWNELETIDFVNDSVICNPDAGETEQCFVTAMALSRRVGEKEQRIMVCSDADFISNDGMNPPQRVYDASNFSMIQGMFDWLSYHKVPIDTRRPPSRDNELKLTKTAVPWMKAGFYGVIPAVLLAWGVLIGIRRMNR